MAVNDTDRHDLIYIMGKLGKHDAALWIHSNNNPSNLKFIVCVESNGREHDFRNVPAAWEWFYEEQRRQKQYERSRRNYRARQRYWNQHMSYM